MSDTQRLIFIGIILGALILILVGTGAAPVLVQAVVAVAQAVGGFLWGLIPKGK